MIITIIEGKELGCMLSRILLLLNHKVNTIKDIREFDINILSQPCIERSDVIISLMDDDADNLISCSYFKKRFKDRIAITKVNNPGYIEKFERLGIDAAFDLKTIVSGLLPASEGI